jgi:hypothetical protein
MCLKCLNCLKGLNCIKQNPIVKEVYGDLDNVTDGIILSNCFNEEINTSNKYPRSLKIFQKYLFDEKGKYNKDMLGKIIVPLEKNNIRICRIYSDMHSTFDDEINYIKQGLKKLVKYAKDNNLIIYVEKNFESSLWDKNDLLDMLKIECREYKVNLFVIRNKCIKTNNNNSFDCTSMAHDIMEDYFSSAFENSFY